jgi:hypothetical protein
MIAYYCRVGRFFYEKLILLESTLEYIHFYVKVPKTAKKILGSSK